EREEGVKKYGLRGAGVGGSVAGEDLGDPKFHPFWAKAEQLGVLVFMHPQADGAAADLKSRLKGSGGLDNTIGNPLETTIALSHLIFEGTLDRFPGLKISAAHGGGYLPSYAARSDAICATFPDRCTKPLRKKPTEYLKQLYFDSLVFTPEALRHLVAEAGSSQIVIGTDYPYPWTKTSVDHILATPGLSDDERMAMLGGTAAKLLGIKRERASSRPRTPSSGRSRRRSGPRARRAAARRPPAPRRGRRGGRTARRARAWPARGAPGSCAGRSCTRAPGPGSRCSGRSRR